MYVSVFEVLRAGPGPSSVQTFGPLAAARSFAHLLEAEGIAHAASRVDVELYGGLACAGRENGTGDAIIAGLSGDAPDQCDATQMRSRAVAVGSDGTLRLNGRQPVAFDAERDIAYRVDRSVEGASNAMRFVARGARGDVIAERSYYSIGDGEVVDPSHARRASENPRVPYPFISAAALHDAGEVVGKKFSAIGFANETVFRSPGDVRTALLGYGSVMRESARRGLRHDDVLPGGRTRRAPAQAIALRSTQGTPAQWCSVLAQAVAEENAAGGRVVAAPTSGYAGPVAALLVHWRNAKPLDEDAGTIDFLMTAGLVGALLRLLRPLLLSLGRFGRANIHAAINGRGVHVNDLDRPARRHRSGRSAFTRGGGACQADYRWRHCPRKNSLSRSPSFQNTHVGRPWLH